MWSNASLFTETISNASVKFTSRICNTLSTVKLYWNSIECQNVRRNMGNPFNSPSGWIQPFSIYCRCQFHLWLKLYIDSINLRYGQFILNSVCCQSNSIITMRIANWLTTNEFHFQLSIQLMKKKKTMILKCMKKGNIRCRLPNENCKYLDLYAEQNRKRNKRKSEMNTDCGIARIWMNIFTVVIGMEINLKNKMKWIRYTKSNYRNRCVYGCNDDEEDDNDNDNDDNTDNGVVVSHCIMWKWIDHPFQFIRCYLVLCTVRCVWYGNAIFDCFLHSGQILSFSSGYLLDIESFSEHLAIVGCQLNDHAVLLHVLVLNSHQIEYPHTHTATRNSGYSSRKDSYKTYDTIKNMFEFMTRTRCTQFQWQLCIRLFMQSIL